MSELWGRSVISAGSDENYNRVTVSPTDLGKDKGVPQVYYMHNCMPTFNGVQAVGYDKAVDELAGHTDFDQCFTLQDSGLNRALFVPAAGKNYILNGPTDVWHSVNPIDPAALPINPLVTTAFVQGQTYIYYELLGCFKYDLTSDSMVSVTLTGLDPTLVRGICSANGYMIAFTQTDIAWSATDDPTNFTPSLQTGSGGGTVNDAKGAIVVCLSIANGFIAYCEKNAVAGKYTGNVNYPYTLVEVPNSGGVVSPSDVSWQGNPDTHFAWTNQGLQELSLTSGNSDVFPEVTEFLAGYVYEDFDDLTNTLSTIYLTKGLSINVTMIANQYVVISYGINSPLFTYAIIFDTSRQRWGKLKFDHVCAFQWNSPGSNLNLSYADETPNAYDFYVGYSYQNLNQTGAGPSDIVSKTLSFLQMDGTVYIVNFDLSEDNASGVMLLGKYQFLRTKGVEHQFTEVENVRTGKDFSMFVIPSIDGKTLLPAVPGIVLIDAPKMRKYGKRVAGQNYSLLFKGSFNMVSVETDFVITGDR